MRLIILVSDNRADYEKEYREVGKNLAPHPGIKLIDFIFPTKYTKMGRLSQNNISKIPRTMN